MTASMWKWTSSASHDPVPDTAMACAFLLAVINWAEPNLTKRVALPTGAVDANELRQVVMALICARGERGERG